MMVMPHVIRRWFGVHDDLTPPHVKSERDNALARVAALERDARLLADEAAAWRSVHGPVHRDRDRPTGGD